MKKLPILLLTIVVGCYGGKQEKKPAQPVSSLDFAKAQAFYENGNDSAFYYFNRVVNSSGDSQQIGIAYYYLAIIQHDAGDYYNSQESLLGALKHLDVNRQDGRYYLFSTNTVIGNNYVALKNYDAGIGYFDLALPYAWDESIKIYALNGKALIYQKKRDYSTAINIFNSIIDHSVNNKKEYARILSNLARAKWLQDPAYNAAAELLTALKIRQTEKDTLGLNASYAHLSDYYVNSNRDSALLYANKMYQVAQYLNSIDDQLEALQKLIILGPQQQLRKYSIRYQQLNDSLQTVRNNTKNQFALIRYDAEKSKAANLILQKDNAEKKVQITQQRLLMYGATLISVLIVVFTISWYRKRNQLIESRAQNSIKEGLLRTAQKVHDLIANGLYQLLKRLEHQPGFTKEQFMDELEILYERSRDISYEHPEAPVPNSQDEIPELLRSYASSDTRVSVVVNNEDLWYHINGRAGKELKYILQELMTNMKKHSQAQNVTVKFERRNNQIFILYLDDGIGIPSSVKFGNGLNSTENRIKAIGGQIIFEKDADKGLKIQITFPTD